MVIKSTPRIERPFNYLPFYNFLKIFSCNKGWNISVRIKIEELQSKHFQTYFPNYVNLINIMKTYPLNPKKSKHMQNVSDKQGNRTFFNRQYIYICTQSPRNLQEAKSSLTFWKRTGGKMGLILAFVRVLFLTFLLVWYTDAGASNGYKVFNVKKYGAVSDGKTENNKVINKSFINLIFLAISDNHGS